MSTSHRHISDPDARAEVEAALDQHRRFPGPDATRLMAHALETVLRVPLLPAEPDPLGVECPRCGAGKRWRCMDCSDQNSVHEMATPHPERVVKAGRQR